MVSPTLYFYPRSPCGERLGTPAARPAQAYFYPRSPCGERPLRSPRIALMVGFLSTLSLRRATKLVQLSPLQYGYFYPRSPCGERPECHLQISRENGISIHALLAESDVTARIIDPTYGKISIHALLAESDPFSRSGPMTHRYFYPRSPCGERRILGRWVRYGEQFLSTLSLRRATA